MPCYKEILFSRKNGTPLKNLPQTLTAAKFRHNGRNFASVVRQLSSTDDRRLLIALSVHLCVRHNGRDAARRVGPSATAEGRVFRSNSSDSMESEH